MILVLLGWRSEHRPILFVFGIDILEIGDDTGMLTRYSPIVGLWFEVLSC